ncbi:PREDICTED: venom acid phosphatase Acph-1-like [Wasmannia auropunctata]|uniref:venom acid phosphatase Acph-1-like n=1 Tax=Wasmannia auropunctata TaxID=64793 RepID=UPI0005EFE85D|nr:PREDICTED: venom acid phosphatase Acph-1-like [Wasmannia auropunctata]XP_011703472.1 PREDICTED: venom acid phosphatase Acph-1-like [Wasmannia auropunctata]XP_011703473.1 PREDICTED: venom acid phosphatase Acph-1-like [Wasmannia auropunctata]XP_011703474.1 PREDICTED: venom acid phosphatase Acph-1-like [Wasmannia auropunctata]
MANFQRLVSIALILYSCLITTLRTSEVSVIKPTKQKAETLRLVNAVFRHGDRIIDRSIQESYPHDPYKSQNFYPDGDGQLTKDGKKRAYELGLALRDRYSNFLGNVYYPPDVYARSTWITRSKMTLQLVLAGLYPPIVDVQKWNSKLLWQPTDMIYFPPNCDQLMFPIACSEYRDTLQELLQSSEVKKKTEEYNDLMKILSNHTGHNITDLLGLTRLHATLYIETFMGLRLPEWTHNVYPGGKLLNASLAFFKILNHERLNNLNGGILLTRIIDDMNEVINGSTKQKINLFSGHDINVAALLYTLNLDIIKHQMPEYTSTVLVELHEKNKKYFVKVLYYLGIPSKTLELSIPGCEVLCPYDKFIKLTKKSTQLRSSKTLKNPCDPMASEKKATDPPLTPFNT